ncbi:hypothetical protein NDU88_011491 [Pleurodeles waltl]|uniref:Uncharacterized protein n=1 Tax=Pleurodeles waltl TaxID=8319 RepID=A0AAV7QYX0_PLEWA|nr:hypothetical protein NDU88_011491 [Pleurodeles waltl]
MKVDYLSELGFGLSDYGEYRFHPPPPRLGPGRAAGIAALRVAGEGARDGGQRLGTSGRCEGALQKRHGGATELRCTFPSVLVGKLWERRPLSAPRPPFLKPGPAHLRTRPAAGYCGNGSVYDRAGEGDGAGRRAKLGPRSAEGSERETDRESHESEERGLKAGARHPLRLDARPRDRASVWDRRSEF